jgi:hypothetical protein
VGQAGQDLFRNAETLDTGRDPAVDGNMNEDGSQLVPAPAIADRTAEMQLPLVHAVERRNHAEVQQTALPVVQAFVTPGGAPAVFRHQLLKFSIEVIGGMQ